MFVKEISSEPDESVLMESPVSTSMGYTRGVNPSASGGGKVVE
jgi:hypothetical protein